MTGQDGTLLGVIGAFKLAKAALLLTLGVTGLISTPWHIGHALEACVAWTGLYAGRETIHRALVKVGSLDGAQLRGLAALSLCYAAVFAIEGLGLLRRKRWAEWLTVVVTTSFIPIEVYELIHEFGRGKVVALVLNAAIVVYLIWRRVRERESANVRH